MMKEISSEIGLIMWVFEELTEKQCSIEDAESLLREYKELCKMESSDGDLVDVVGQSEQLKAFAQWCYGKGYADVPDCYIEQYIESL